MISRESERFLINLWTFLTIDEQLDSVVIIVKIKADRHPLQPDILGAGAVKHEVSHPVQPQPVRLPCDRMDDERNMNLFISP